MATATESIGPRRFTVEEYHRMAESGIFEQDERVELIRGVVRRMSPKNYAHVVAATSLYQVLVRALAGRASVYQEAPLRLTALDSEPEPDILVTSSPNIEDYGKEESKPLLIVEVADSSLNHDLNAKASLYAEAGVPEHWVLNLVDRELVVFRAPEEGAYLTRVNYRAGESVALEAWADIAIDTSDLFPAEKSGASGTDQQGDEKGGHPSRSC